MELSNIEMDVIQTAVGEIALTADRELSYLELATVGGGIGETVL